MKLCSQCEFIYEDDQELCDMDGAELVYEPTLERVFPNNVVQVNTELERRAPARLVIPLKPENSIARPHVLSSRRRLALQIATVVMLIAISFMAFYATPRLFQTQSQTVKNTPEIQKPRVETSLQLPIISNAAATSEKPEAQETKPELSRSSPKGETVDTKLETAFAPLPGLKPLPRLKPIPRVKPIPRLSERSESAGRKGIVVNTGANTKKDSRFGSFLKKTGRMLTKPFKS
jgi:hypothetical protein